MPSPALSHREREKIRSEAATGQKHSAVLTHPCHQLFRAVDSVGNDNQRLAERNGVAQAFVAHGVIRNGIDIRHVRKPHASANQLGAAEANCIVPDFFRNAEA